MDKILMQNVLCSLLLILADSESIKLTFPITFLPLIIKYKENEHFNSFCLE